MSRTGVFVRGVLMGVAEVVPGVSGGTVAFITGIYRVLIASLASFGASSLRMAGNPAEFWRAHNLTFLLTLAAGMLVGAVAFARLMQFLLDAYQPAVWAFFGGVILASVAVIGRARRPDAMLKFFLPGVVLGAGLLMIPPAAGSVHLISLFFGGVIAVSAWLLPAISGSYLLLVLGMYEPVVAAIAQLDPAVLGAVGLGCAVGILSFAKLLSWCLRRFPEALLSTLCGFMLGSVPKLWPWQLDTGAATWQQWLLPAEFVRATGQAELLPLVVIMAAAGGGVVWLFGRAAPTPL